MRTAFQSHAHGTDGFASVIDTGAGHVVRIEELDTDNGPDVIVVLSTNEASNPSLGETVHLGELKGNKGNQNYAVPAGTDVTKYKSVVLWCRRFSVAFGSAPIPS